MKRKTPDSPYPRGLVLTHEEEDPDLYVSSGTQERRAVEEECAAMRTHAAMQRRRERPEQ